tara:strand:+ start:330 stop:962 length:633 start_codon:yes stop_codon:yes gene_type:complete
MWHILGTHTITESGITAYDVQFQNSLDLYKQIRVIFNKIGHTDTGDLQINLKPAREMYGEIRSNASAAYGFGPRADDNSSTGTSADAISADPGMTQYGLAWAMRGTASIANNYSCGILDFFNGGSNDNAIAMWSFYNPLTSTNYNRYHTGSSYQNAIDSSFNGFGIQVQGATDAFDSTLGGTFIILGLPRTDYHHKIEGNLPHKDVDGDN